MKCKSCMVICSLVMWTGKSQDDDDTKGTPVVKPISITVLFFCVCGSITVAAFLLLHA